MTFSTDDFVIKVALQVDDSQLKNAQKNIDRANASNRVGRSDMRMNRSDRASGSLAHTEGRDALRAPRQAALISSGVLAITGAVGLSASKIVQSVIRLVDKFSSLNLKSQLTGATPFELYQAGIIGNALGAPGSIEGLAESKAQAQALKANVFTRGEYQRKVLIAPMAGIDNYQKIVSPETSLVESMRLLVDLIARKNFTTAELKNLVPFFGSAAVAAASKTNPREFEKSVLVPNLGLSYGEFQRGIKAKTTFDVFYEKKKTQFEKSFFGSLEPGINFINSPLQDIKSRAYKFGASTVGNAIGGVPFEAFFPDPFTSNKALKKAEEMEDPNASFMNKRPFTLILNVDSLGEGENKFENVFAVDNLETHIADVNRIA